MRKLITFTAAALLASAAANAADSPTSTGLESNPASQTAMQASQTVETETQDGHKVEIAPDGTVSVYQGEQKAPPADGTLTLKDGSTINIKDGKKV